MGVPCGSLNHRAKYARRLATIHEAAIFRRVMCLMLVLLGIALQATAAVSRVILRNAEPQVDPDGMELASQARGNFMRGTLAAVIALCFIPIGSASLPASDESTRLQRTDESGFGSFSKAIANYVHLKQRLRSEIPPWRVTDSSAEIIARSDAWALAIQRARPGAQQGDFFDQATADAIKERLARTLKGTNVAALLSRINDEPPLEASPRVHLRFPDASPMPTMPPRVLEVLPALPAELEYRFVGRTLVLRDRDAALILDYLPNALPPS